ncbi:MAG TPA: hypothetical protein VGG71_02435, partial [Chitinophagaceae bacterium]
VNKYFILMLYVKTITKVSIEFSQFDLFFILFIFSWLSVSSPILRVCQLTKKECERNKYKFHNY